METIGLIGAGNMAEAIIRGIITSGLYTAENIMASDIRPDRLAYIAQEYGVQTTQDNLELIDHAQVVIICVKPQNVPKMLEGISGKFNDGMLLVSIAAGVTTTYLEKQLGQVPIIRAMPNTPAMVDQGATALFTGNAPKECLDHARELFEAMGKVVIVDNEEMIDAITAVSGTGPAYFFLLMEEMVSAAREMNIPADIAEELVYQTARGAGELAQQAYARGESPAELRRKVTSPKGTTEAAVHVFLSRDFGGTIFSGIKAARDRSVELSEEVQRDN
jgi:pyrroline-5-carboxylate reductase